MSRAMLLASILGMTMGSSFDIDGITRLPRKEKEPKNKYGLTEEQIAAMENMTPKEKKRFLKSLGKGSE